MLSVRFVWFFVAEGAARDQVSFDTQVKQVCRCCNSETTNRRGRLGWNSRKARFLARTMCSACLLSENTEMLRDNNDPRLCHKVVNRTFWNGTTYSYKVFSQSQVPRMSAPSNHGSSAATD